jgi:hypothetical protein
MLGIVAVGSQIEALGEDICRAHHRSSAQLDPQNGM